MSKIIEEDTKIIGKIEDIEKYFKNEMIKEIQGGIDIEEMKYNFNMMFDVLLEIQENEQEAYNNECLFEIQEHAMGGYIYKVYEKRGE